MPRGRTQLCTPVVAPLVRDAVETYRASARWQPHVLVLMPDHFHLLTTIATEADIQRIVLDMKRFVCRRGKVRWQRGFFEHRLRAHEHFNAKRAYLRENPVRAGLVDDPSEWPYFYEW